MIRSPDDLQMLILFLRFTTNLMIMRKILLFLSLMPMFLQAQICTPGSNVVLFTNYDGGILNINVDVNIPNLRIGIVSYEAVQINFSGPFVNNITEVRYAGFNSSNNNCGQLISTTTFSGLPGSAVTSITFAPPAPVSDPNGNNSIICAYSCNASSNQGGCNTVDQVVAYFYQIFNVNSLYSHTIQYGCWTGTQNISAGGNCCPTAPPPPPLLNSATGTNATCTNSCNGSATANPTGGLSPYSYAWSSNANNATTQTVTGLCAGTYSVTVTDAAGTQSSSSVTISAPSAISAVGTVVQPNCFGENGSIQMNITGGVSPYSIGWNGLNPQEIPPGQHSITISDANACSVNYSFEIIAPEALSGVVTVTPDVGGCSGSMSVVVSGGTAPYSYSWPSGEVGPGIINLCSGEYCLEVTDLNGCIEEFCGTVQSLVNLEQHTLHSINFSIAPNPSAANTTLFFENANQQTFNISVVDLSGKILYTKTLFSPETGETTIDLDAPSGVYFIPITTATGESQTLKWVRY